MRRPLAIAAGVALLAGLAALALSTHGEPDATRADVAGGARPTLMLLTSLPLMFGERFGLGEGGSAALARIERDFAVEPIAATERDLLRRGRLLLMAHARAQPAEQLVELDEWVRGGGRLLLLADPAVDWPSEKPLGDLTRPPPAFADTGLLAHWGLRLDGPEPDGPSTRAIDGMVVLASTPGRLSAAPGSACRVGDGGFVAHCALGKGAVMVIADADFLNVAGGGALDGPTEHNLDALVAALDSLASR